MYAALDTTPEIFDRTCLKFKKIISEANQVQNILLTTWHAHQWKPAEGK